MGRMARKLKQFLLNGFVWRSSVPNELSSGAIVGEEIQCKLISCASARNIQQAVDTIGLTSGVRPGSFLELLAFFLDYADAIPDGRIIAPDPFGYMRTYNAPDMPLYAYLDIYTDEGEMDVQELFGVRKALALRKKIAMFSQNPPVDRNTKFIVVLTS